MPKPKLYVFILLICFITIGLGAVREASAFIAATALHVTYIALVIASVGAAIYERHRGHWRGFAIAGWSYFLPVFVFSSAISLSQMVTTKIISSYAYHTIPSPVPPQGLHLATVEEFWPKIGGFTGNGDRASSKALKTSINVYNTRIDNAITIGQSFLTLTVALIGSLVGRAFQSHSAGDTGGLPTSVNGQRRPETLVGKPPVPPAAGNSPVALRRASYISRPATIESLAA